jgi:hypothetical protein
MRTDQLGQSYKRLPLPPARETYRSDRPSQPMLKQLSAIAQATSEKRNFAAVVCHVAQQRRSTVTLLRWAKGCACFCVGFRTFCTRPGRCCKTLARAPWLLCVQQLLLQLVAIAAIVAVCYSGVYEQLLGEDALV